MVNSAASQLLLASVRKFILRDKRGLEESLVIKLIIVVIFLVIVLGIIYLVSQRGNSEIGTLCERTGGQAGCT